MDMWLCLDENGRDSEWPNQLQQACKPGNNVCRFEKPKIVQSEEDEATELTGVEETDEKMLDKAWHHQNTECHNEIRTEGELRKDSPIIPWLVGGTRR